MTRAKRRFIGPVLLGAALLASACSSGDDGGGGEGAGESTTTNDTIPERNDSLRMDEIQVIGTHNSFRVAPDPAELALLAAMDPEQAAQREYTHRPIPEQLEDQRIRQFELDVFADAEGGLFAEPALRGEAGLVRYADEEPDISEPGTKVMHEQDVDYRSVCILLTTCLQEIADWSDLNPGHVPIAVQIQFKDGPLIFPVEGQAKPEPWTVEAMDDLDRTIEEVLGDKLLVPDDVRGDHETLEGAILVDGWPTLGEARGRVMFLMTNGDPYRERYLEGHPSLGGRVLFTNSEPGRPEAAYMAIDDPMADGERIAEMVGAGYLVRTRSDAPDRGEAETGDTTRLDAALASGAHWISTDYPGPDGAKPQYGTDYVAQLPGFLAARCNPVSAPASCEDAGVEPAGAGTGMEGR